MVSRNGNADVDSPPRIKNVIQPGEWDPSTPIRFGDVSIVESYENIHDSFASNFEAGIEVSQSGEGRREN